ncbi:MAG: ThiF family adenylyltransferase [bacterium]|nr:ThiF family adenylyltransferase [bacterium]
MSVGRYSRQSFLGKEAQSIIEKCTVGVLGLGGGGSHTVQQLSHIGFENYILFDPDIVKHVNLNRLVGATENDAKKRMPKINVARRVILGLEHSAHIESYKAKWQTRSAPLRACDIIFGCVDTFAQRREIEDFARRYLIPYIDIGMDVHESKDRDNCFGMAGQVIVSMPGGPCMRCINFLSEANLAREASNYGAAGGRPQVVWANGVLASTAVGFAIDILTGWTKTSPVIAYMSYRGNDGTIIPHVRLEHLKVRKCTHFPLEQTGDPGYRRL